MTDRPRERLRDAGPAALSNQELLAILLRTGTASESALTMASRLLGRFGGLIGLARASFSELQAERGLGEAKAAQVQASIELGKRVVATQPQERPVIRFPQDAAKMLPADLGLPDPDDMRVPSRIPRS